MSSKTKEENNDDNSNTNVFKILTIGDGGVGKTSILRRYVENKFLKHHLSTIGIDFLSKTLKIKDKEIKLKIWDTAGQERYRQITSHIYKDADGIILVFDVTSEESFNQITDWMEQIKNNVSKEEINLILIGNKCDLADRMVEKERGEKMAEKLKIKYFETSALTGQGINEAFEELAKQIFRNKNPNENISRNISISYDKSEDALKKKKGKGCC
jgi:small GTP-binding protein